MTACPQPLVTVQWMDFCMHVVILQTLNHILVGIVVQKSILENFVSLRWLSYFSRPMADLKTSSKLPSGSRTAPVV